VEMVGKGRDSVLVDVNLYNPIQRRKEIINIFFISFIFQQNTFYPFVFFLFSLLLSLYVR
jgi:hypothetical protein